MIEKIYEILKLVAAILPFVVLCVANTKINLPQTKRSKQFLMPLLALVYVIVAMIFMNRLNDWLLNIIYGIPKWIVGLAGFPWMPAAIGSILVVIANFVENLIRSLNLNFWIFFIANIVLITAYLAVKKAAVVLMSKIKEESKLHQVISGYFYEFFYDRGVWCIKDKFGDVRTLLKVFYIGAVAISSLLMLISRYFYFDGLLRTIYYPVFGILVVGEMYFYLNGLTKDEYVNDVLGENEDAYKIVNYALLRKFLRNLFGDKEIAENTSVNSALAYGVTNEEILQQLEMSEDQKVVSFGTYFTALSNAGFEIDHNYLYSSLDLLNGKSILFNNPFYYDLIPYAFYPLNRTLLSHRKVLIVLGRHDIEGDIMQWVEQGIESITNIPFMWKMKVLDKNTEECDIGIITRSDVLNIDVHDANEEFLSQVGFVVVLEPSKLLSTAQIGLNLIVKRCLGKDKQNIVYCLCDKNCDGLVDAMSHTLMTSITEVSATNKHRGTMSYMSWEADEDYLHHRIVPNISRYLGFGTELSFAALKSQVSKTEWYGGDAFPVVDMKWIDRQYYYDLMKYAGLPANQEFFDERFVTSSNFWNARVERYNYFTVEDEFYNMFEILRDFSTRTTDQGFINVVSTEYLLKDYMGDNSAIFEADAKAIPYIAADYTRSERNTVLRLILMMSASSLDEEFLVNELSLLGRDAFDLKKQLWYEVYKCYATVAELASLSEVSDDYETIVEEASKRTIKRKVRRNLASDNGEIEFGADIITEAEVYNNRKADFEILYSVTDKAFISLCVDELKSASYIAEDEEGEKYYLGAELRGHIYQKYLPGQFFTFGGKYYEMQYLTANGQVLVRRAADHIIGRPTYRQIRHYTVMGTSPSERIGTHKDISGIRVSHEFADFKVETPGYYHMLRYNDFETAKRIYFEGDKTGIPERSFNNKEILKIELPDNDGKFTDTVRYTITVLMNEVFRTLFAENQAFICAVTDTSHIDPTKDPNPLTYTVSTEDCELQKNCIYIIEDSQLDLGLTVTVERNFQRIMHIIEDYLLWNQEALRLSLIPPEDPKPPIVFTGKKADEEPKTIGDKIKGGMSKFVGKVKDVFKRRKKGEEPSSDPATDPTDKPIIDSEPSGEDPAVTHGDDPTKEPDGKKRKGIKDWFKGIGKKKDKKKKGKNGDDTSAEEPIAPIEPLDPAVTEEPSDTTGATGAGAAGSADTTDTTDTTDSADSDATGDNGSGETPVDAGDINNLTITGNENFPAPADGQTDVSADERPKDTKELFERRPYHERCYLYYGKTNEPEIIDSGATLEYIRSLILARNPLTQAREGKDIAAYIEATYKPNKANARYCDFCGAEIFGVEFETLTDGRDRCINCSRTAIKTEDEFRRIFEGVRRNMESFFGIRINTGIRVEMVNSRTLHKKLKQPFNPSAKYDPRILGVAIKDKSGYKLMIESGAPRMQSMLTIAHELTHIWQYLNWNDKEIKKKYGKNMRLEIYEGMAKWVEIQYAYLINEPAVAKREEIITSYRDDEYGRGFLRYRANYPFSTGTIITRPTPFMNIDTPLELQYCDDFVFVPPDVDVNLPVPEDPTKDQPTGGTDSEIPGTETPHIPSGSKGALAGPIERDSNKLTLFAYQLLSDMEKEVYEKLYEAVAEFAPSVSFATATVDKEQFIKIAEYIRRDHPELDWFNQGLVFYCDANNLVTRAEITYCLTREELAQRSALIDEAIQPFVASISDNMSDFEVVLRVYENIISLVDYDSIGLAEQERKQNLSPDKPDDLRSLYGVFVNKRAVCAGYAKATQYLLNLFGIECIYASSGDHAWNVIKLEGDYYHMDVTWGDQSNTDPDLNGSQEINYNYFCITTAETLRIDMHTPRPELKMPECTATKCNYHHRFGLYMDSYDFEKAKSIIIDNIVAGNLNVSIKVSNETELKKMVTDLVDNHNVRDALKIIGLEHGIRLDMSYTYSVKNDLYILSFGFKKI